MSGKRRAGITPAIGWALPGLLLATGLSAARADELADLRANQELLQRRIDQLAQAGPAAFPAPPGSRRAGAGRQLPALLRDPRHRSVAARRRPGRRVGDVVAERPCDRRCPQ